MLELEGKYTSAKIFADTIENGVIEQVKSVLEHPIFKDCQIRIMPDCHSGKGCVIGFTSPLPKNGEIIPNIIGVDIHCGMLAIKLSDKDIVDFSKLDKVINRNIPVGRDGRKIVSKRIPEEFIEEIKYWSKDWLKDNFLTHMQKIGSLGDGNHFISIEKGSTGTYLIIHTGSRNIGNKLAIEFQKLAIEKHCYGEGRLKELSYLDGIDAENYVKCMHFCEEYARLNRDIIAHDIMVGMRWKEIDRIETIHNYINKNDKIIRKGAITCNKDELAIIPINMAYGTFIVKGKGNLEWNNSGPHGAGRILSRTQAENTLTMQEYKESMKNIYSSCISTNTLDEAPMAYKNGDEIKKLITPTADIVDHLIPIYNFKANVNYKKNKK